MIARANAADPGAERRRAQAAAPEASLVVAAGELQSAASAFLRRHEQGKAAAEVQTAAANFLRGHAAGAGKARVGAASGSEENHDNFGALLSHRFAQLSNRIVTTAVGSGAVTESVVTVQNSYRGGAAVQNSHRPNRIMEAIVEAQDPSGTPPGSPPTTTETTAAGQLAASAVAPRAVATLRDEDGVGGGSPPGGPEGVDSSKPQAATGSIAAARGAAPQPPSLTA